MKAYLPFGDWSADGHGRYINVLVNIFSMNDLLEAEKDIKTIYGKYFFGDFANESDTPRLSEECWQALIDNQMPVSILINYDENNDWRGVESIKQALELDESPSVSLAFVIQAFIWLLNQYGANILLLPEDQEIPQINSLTCPGFETVGYGCFYD